MLEFMFFDEGLRDRFVQFVQAQGIACTAAADTIAGWVVRFKEDLADETLEAIEELYDELMVEQEALAEAEDGWVEKHLAGFQVTLPDGATRTIRLDPEIANRLLEHLSPLEAQALVEAVAHAIVSGSDGPICCN